METDRIDAGHQSGKPNPVIRFLQELMTNKHRGYDGLRAGGGPHPVSEIGKETGGQAGETFTPEYDYDDIVAILRDGVLGTSHDLLVKANGPFNGYILPGHTFQANQYAFPILGATDIPSPVRIVNAYPYRLDILIKCTQLANGAVYIGSSETLNAQNGYPLALGEVVTLPTRSEIWAISTCVTTQAIVATLATMRDG